MFSAKLLRSICINITGNVLRRNERQFFQNVHRISIIGYENNLTGNFNFVRNYAKSKDKKKEKGKNKVVEVNENVLSEVINLDSMKKQMQKSVDILREEFIKNLSLRSSTGSIESLPVHFEGKDYRLQEIAQVVRKNPTTVIINMNVFPQAIPTVLKVIAKSGMNLNPQQDGTTLFIPIPKVTKEHRENLAKNAKSLFIKCRDNIKDTQNKYSKNVKKQENISIDLIHNIQDQILTIANQYIKDAEKIFSTKQNELLGTEKM